MGKSLKKVDVDVLVLQSGRNLEQAARELIPEERDPEGKPLMLGARMYRLRDQLDEETWSAFHEWSQQRNAYVHGSSASIGDRDEFYNNYKEVLDALEELAEDDVEPDESITPIVIGVLVLVGILFYAC